MDNQPGRVKKLLKGPKHEGELLKGYRANPNMLISLEDGESQTLLEFARANRRSKITGILKEFAAKARPTKESHAPSCVPV